MAAVRVYRAAEEAGENPAQYPLLYWKSSIPFLRCVFCPERQKPESGRSLWAESLWEGGMSVMTPKSEYSLLTGSGGYGDMTGVCRRDLFVAPEISDGRRTSMFSKDAKSIFYQTGSVFVNRHKRRVK